MFLSTFMGRPPHLSHRFSVVQQPRELSDEEMCLKETELQEVIAGLEHTLAARPPSRMTWRRASWKRHEIREDILEIAIGTSSAGLEERIE
jgi:hypothetical protein